MNIITIAGYNYGVLDADEFIAQGTTAGAITSIAEHLSQYGSPLLAAEVRNTARLVADCTGQSLHIPGAVTDSRLAERRRRRAANDNRSRHSGEPRNRRVA